MQQDYVNASSYRNCHDYEYETGIVVYQANERKNNMFEDNTVIHYVYSMTGEKLRVTRAIDAGGIGPILRDGVSDSQAEGDMTDGSMAQISNALILDDTEYLDADFTNTHPDGTCM